MKEHNGKVSFGRKTFTNLQFADDIGPFVKEEQQLEALAESLDKNCRRHELEISAEKTKFMTNSTNGIQEEDKSLQQFQASSTL